VGGEIYSQGMKMSRGEVYSQGTAISIPWETTDSQPFSQGCVGTATNCTQNVAGSPASDPPNNQIPGHFSSASDGFAATGNDAIGGPASFAFLDPAPPWPADDPPIGGGSGPPSGSATSALLSPNLPPPTGPVAYSDPLPEPGGLALFGPALLFFGLVLQRARSGRTYRK
jgi:hypothetical protein